MNRILYSEYYSVYSIYTEETVYATKMFVSSFPRDNTVYPNGPVWIVISVGAVYAPPPPTLAWALY
jgi:hypothetical protein